MNPLPSGTKDEFLFNASLLYKETCPELSRFLMQGPVSINGKQESSCLSLNTLVCPHCCQWLQPDNHRIRLRPKQRPSAQVKRILRRSAKGKRLTLMQKNLLRNFKRSPSVLMATCHTCNRTSRHKGMNRDFTTTLPRNHSTPGSAVKHKPPGSASRSNKSTPKTPSKDKTPVHTPRSSSSSNTPVSGSSSTKSASKPKNWVVQRLSKILMRDDNKGSKKGGLKDFLSSL
ncbi:UPF0711 protein C18orf21 homolog [Solea solea]|uniref:UPF0711 protein C18orf21 homolog n=1 Tax=Solea solea TaxID=90069 RepID=UPI00272AFC8A|nr:UPF0711 protein C18orf21 homolog [Solea solea]XP_058475889.1 UPF0711 protein C18orf21 homolog [Solea solea]